MTEQEVSTGVDVGSKDVTVTSGTFEYIDYGFIPTLKRFWNWHITLRNNPICDTFEQAMKLAWDNRGMTIRVKPQGKSLTGSSITITDVTQD